MKEGSSSLYISKEEAEALTQIGVNTPKDLIQKLLEKPQDATPPSFKPCTWFPDADCPIGDLPKQEIIKVCGRSCPLMLDFKASLRNPKDKFTTSDQERYQKIQRRFYPQTQRKCDLCEKQTTVETCGECNLNLCRTCIPTHNQRMPHPFTPKVIA